MKHHNTLFGLAIISLQWYCTVLAQDCGNGNANCSVYERCYQGSCYPAASPCIDNTKCFSIFKCLTTDDGSKWCLYYEPTTTTTATATSTSTATTAQCEDKVGPNGQSNCVPLFYLCNNPLYRDLMTQQCPKTCGRCPGSATAASICKDKVGPGGVSNCASVAYLCNNALYYNLMTDQCPKTCGRCQ